MNNLVPDELVDALEIKALRQENNLQRVKVQGSKNLLVICSSLGCFNWSEMLYLASAVWNHGGVSINGNGFRYPSTDLYKYLNFLWKHVTCSPNCKKG